MRAIWMAGVFAAHALAGCGNGKPEPEEQPAKEKPMKVEDTVFGTLVGTPDKVRDRTNAAMEEHKAALEAQISKSEDAQPEDAKPEE